MSPGPWFARSDLGPTTLGDRTRGARDRERSGHLSPTPPPAEPTHQGQTAHVRACRQIRSDVVTQLVEDIRRGAVASDRTPSTRGDRCRLRGLRNDEALGVRMLPLLRRVLHIEDHDFLCCLIDSVVDEVGILSRDELTDSLRFLPSADLRKQKQRFQAVIDGSAYSLCRRRVWARM